MYYYNLEDFMVKPFVYKHKKKGQGLNMENALCCLLYICLNCWNSQTVISKLVASGLCRGGISLIVVTYFVTLPGIMLCLYFGKFLKRGALSLQNCSPILAGVGVGAILMAFPLGSMMVYYPLSENMFMYWLFEFKCNLPPCTELKKKLNFYHNIPCIEEKDAYKCCTSHGSNNEICVLPYYPFYILYDYIHELCMESDNFMNYRCNYWLLFFIVCIVILLTDIKRIYKVLLFIENLYLVNILVIICLAFMYIDTTILSLFNYYNLHHVYEPFLDTVFELTMLEFDNMSMCLPYLLMVGRLLDDSVEVHQLAIELVIAKMLRLFFQVNEYVAVINIVAANYHVENNCLHNTKRGSLISLAIIPELFALTYARVIKFPMFMFYYITIFLKKLGSMIIFGNLLSYHFYYWEKKEASNDSNKVHVYQYNVRGKFVMKLVKVVVYTILNICQRFFNLSMIESVTTNMMPYKFALRLMLGIQMTLFIYIILSVHSAERFKEEVEALTMKKLWPELIKHLTIQRILFATLLMIQCMQYYVWNNFQVEDNSALETGVTGDWRYLMLPVIYLVGVFCVSILYIISKALVEWKIRILPASEEWGPINKKGWKGIKPFNPGRKLLFYDEFYIPNHICVLNHTNIRLESHDQMDKVDLFALKWPKIFETDKYKRHKEEIDQLIIEAYKWSILGSYN